MLNLFLFSLSPFFSPLPPPSSQGKTVTLKLKNVNFEVKTRASTVLSSVSTEEEIFAIAKDLLGTEIDSVAPHPLRIRLMGKIFQTYSSFSELALIMHKNNRL